MTRSSPVVLVCFVWLGCGDVDRVSVGMPGGTGTGTSESGSTTSTTNGCVDVHEGDLVVDGATALESLATLRLVDGDLTVEGVETEDLSFLACLEEVTGGVYVRANPHLRTLEGAARLEGIGTAAPQRAFVPLLVEGNPELESLAGLVGLRELEGGLHVHDNAALTSIGMPALEVISGEGLDMGKCADLSSEEPSEGHDENPGITELGSGFPMLEEIGSITVYGHSNLVSLSGFTALAEAGTRFSVLRFGINPILPEQEIMMLAAAAGIDEAISCQNRDNQEKCVCLPD